MYFICCLFTGAVINCLRVFFYFYFLSFLEMKEKTLCSIVFIHCVCVPSSKTLLFSYFIIIAIIFCDICETILHSWNFKLETISKSEPKTGKPTIFKMLCKHHCFLGNLSLFYDVFPAIDNMQLKMKKEKCLWSCFQPISFFPSMLMLIERIGIQMNNYRVCINYGIKFQFYDRVHLVSEWFYSHLSLSLSVLAMHSSPNGNHNFIFLLSKLHRFQQSYC